MASRVGIENWPEEAIFTWLNYIFAAKQLPNVVNQARDIYLNEFFGISRKPANKKVFK